MAEETESVRADQSRGISWSEAVLLAAVPIAAYAATFAYQTGYFGVFGLPLELIETNVRNALVVLARVFTPLFLTYMLAEVSSMIVGARWPPPISRRLRRVAYLYVVAIALMMLYRSDRRLWGGWLIGATVLTLVEFVLPYLAGSGKGYLERLSDSDRRSLERSAEAPLSLTDKLILAIGVGPYKVVFYYGFVLFLAFHAGRAEATQRRVFYVANTSPESAVLYFTASTAICAPFDRDTGDLEPSFSILKMEDHADIVFRTEEIGPLHVPSPTPTVVPSPTPTATPSPTPTATPTTMPAAP